MTSIRPTLGRLAYGKVQIGHVARNLVEPLQLAPRPPFAPHLIRAHIGTITGNRAVDGRRDGGLLRNRRIGQQAPSTAMAKRIIPRRPRRTSAASWTIETELCVSSISLPGSRLNTDPPGKDFDESCRPARPSDAITTAVSSGSNIAFCNGNRSRPGRLWCRVPCPGPSRL